MSPCITPFYKVLMLTCLCAVGCLTGCGRPSAPGASPPKPQTLGELQKAISASLAKNAAPGAGVALVARDRVIWAGGFGKADLAAKRDITADTMFRVGSISKSFVALALLKLQEEGKIDLSARLRDIAPEIEVHNPWEQTHPVTIANLLEHSAGFDDMRPRELYNTHDPPDIPLKEVFALFPEPQHVRWLPSTRMAYSNPGYGIAGYVVEKLTGRAFEDYLQDAILAPLGMTHSSFRLTENRALLAQGYEGYPPEPTPYRHIYLRPAGELKSSPAEMARFVQLMLNRGRFGERQLVRPESIDRMEVPQTTLASRSGLKNGYGLGVYVSLDHRIKEYGHDGGIGGFVSTYRYLPEQGLGYVVLLNISTPRKSMRDITGLVFDYLTAGLSAPQEPEVKLGETELTDFAGYYEPASPRQELFGFAERLIGGRWVSVDRAKLYRRRSFGRKEPLIPVSRTQFRLEKEPEASGIFCTAEDGTRVLAGGFNYSQKVNLLWPLVRLALVTTGLLLMTSSLMFAVVWIPRKVLGRMRNVSHLHVRILPLLAVLSLVSIIILFLRLVERGDPGALNLPTVSFWAGTWLYAVLSAGSLMAALRSFRLDVKPGVRVHSLLVALACCGVAAYLAYWDVIGLKLWAY